VPSATAARQEDAVDHRFGPVNHLPVAIEWQSDHGGQLPRRRDTQFRSLATSASN
jgi:hypothetical protein